MDNRKSIRPLKPVPLMTAKGSFREQVQGKKKTQSNRLIRVHPEMVVKSEVVMVSIYLIHAYT